MIVLNYGNVEKALNPKEGFVKQKNYFLELAGHFNTLTKLDRFTEVTYAQCYAEIDKTIKKHGNPFSTVISVLFNVDSKRRKKGADHLKDLEAWYDLATTRNLTFRFEIVQTYLNLDWLTEKTKLIWWKANNQGLKNDVGKIHLYKILDALYEANAFQIINYWKEYVESSIGVEKKGLRMVLNHLSGTAIIPKQHFGTIYFAKEKMSCFIEGTPNRYDVHWLRGYKKRVSECRVTYSNQSIEISKELFNGASYCNMKQFESNALPLLKSCHPTSPVLKGDIFKDELVWDNDKRVIETIKRMVYFCKYKSSNNIPTHSNIFFRGKSLVSRPNVIAMRAS